VPPRKKLKRPLGSVKSAKIPGVDSFVWKLIVCLPIEITACLLLIDPSKLFKEKRHAGSSALAQN
jgi:hypothetical protein